MKKCIPIFMWMSIVILAGVFLAAALPKIYDPAGFAKSIYGYKLIPGSWVNSIALILPQLEAIAAVALFFPRTRKAAVTWIGIMLVMFTFAQLQAIIRGIEGGCGCFGTGEKGDRIGWIGVGRNVILTGLAGWVWVVTKRRSSTTSI